MLVPLAFAALAHATSPDLYQRSVQEDEVLEWITFWTFALAAFAYLRAARDARRGGSSGWFLVGLALFCGVVAGEEISWAQRIFAYRPPAYFLEHNFQQEANLHNVVESGLRKLAFLGVTLGYGVALPLAGAVAPLRRVGSRLGIVAPSLWLTPAFLATAALYVAYPWSHTGEWAEAMLGLGFLQAAILASGHARVTALLAATAGVVALGFATTALWWVVSRDDPERRSAAEVELRALAEDFSRARTRTRCGLHKRVYSMVRKYDQGHLHEGAFASLTTGGLPEERADFFLDPWNSPYWIRHECSADRRRRAIFVYSFGPNRLRDSNDWEIVPDDVGAWISRPKAAPED